MVVGRWGVVGLISEDCLVIDWLFLGLSAVDLPLAGIRSENATRGCNTPGTESHAAITPITPTTKVAHPIFSPISSRRMRSKNTSLLPEINPYR